MEPQTNAPSTPLPSTPKEYTAFTAPEGITLDSKAVEGATAIFRELGLDQSQAQKLIDYQLNRDKELTENSARVYADTRKEWRQQIESDPEVGGDKLAATKAEIAKTVDLLPPKLRSEFKAAMDYTGAGDNPGIVKAFLFFSKMLNEGQYVSGGGPSEAGQTRPGVPARPNAASAIFPNLPSASTQH